MTFPGTCVRGSAALLAAGALAACGASPGATTTPTPVATASPTTLPAVTVGLQGADIIVPLTTQTGPGTFRPVKPSGSDFLLEYACIGGGAFDLSYGTTSSPGTCDGAPQVIEDNEAHLTPQTTITVTVGKHARWHVVVIENR